MTPGAPHREAPNRAVAPTLAQVGLDVNDVQRKETQVAKLQKNEATVQKAREGERRTNPDSGSGSTPEVEEPQVLEEICVEELAIDGICGVY